MIGVTDHAGSVWENAYDMLGNRLSARDPDLGLWTYIYNSANRLITQTDARYIQTGMTYDRLGRLLERRILNAPGEPNPVLTSNTYDEARTFYNHNVGHLTTSVNSSRTLRFDYSINGLLQQTNEFDSSGFLHNTFVATNVDGSVRYKTYYPGPLDVGTEFNRWTYDALGRLIGIPGMIKSQTYELDGQTKSITYQNDVTTTFTYSATRRWLDRVTTKSESGALLMDNAYSRVATGRIYAAAGLKVVAGLNVDDSWSYNYDELDRLTYAYNPGDLTLTEAFTYDLADNMLSRSRMLGAYVYPAPLSPRPHTPVSVGDRPFTYDANGNLISDGKKTLTWSLDNRLNRGGHRFL